MVDNIMSNEDMEQLPEAVVRNAEKIQLDQEQSDKHTNLLDKLLDHIQNEKSNYIPWQKVQLPSKGLYYDDKMPNGYLEVRPMGVDIDKMLTNQTLIQSGTLLNKVLEACTRLPDNFNIREMLSGDFNFLLYYLRGITHGPEYEFVSDCPHCKTKNVYTFNLNNLQETITWADISNSEEPFSVTMPKLSESFGHDVKALVRLIRVDDIMRMANPTDPGIFDPVQRGSVSVRKNKKNKTEVKNEGQDLEKVYEENMKSQIIGFEINDEKFKDRDRINVIINKMHQTDAAVIRKYLEKVSPGIDTTLDVICTNPDCKKETSVNLPFNESFFRPQD